MRSRDIPISPEVAAELEALEAALAGDPSADPELLALVADTRAQRPAIDPDFEATLASRVAAGFPRPAGSWAARLDGLRSHRRQLLPALGVAATLMAGLVVIGLNAGGGDEEPASLRGSAPTSAAEADSAVGVTQGPVPSVTQAAPSPSVGSAVPLARDQRRAKAAPFGRKVERAAQLTLTTSADDVQDVADGVVRTTQTLGGYVSRSQVSTTEGGGEATFTLRIPTKRLDEAIARLSKLANVGSLTQDSTDITSSFVSATDRLSDARAERRALLRALGRATTQSQIESLRRRIAINRSQIAALKGELGALRRRADLATVAVTVEGTGKRRETGGGAWTPGDALGDAVRVLEVAAGVALVGLAVLAPLALLGALAAFAARSTRRRRREGALEGA